MDNKTNDIDLRKLLRLLREHWWWFATGVGVCVLLGVSYFVRKAPKWTTDACVMLRSKDAGSQMEAFSMLGLTGNNAAEDEVVVFSSRGLLYQSIDALDIWEPTSVRGGIRWEGEFPKPSLRVDYIELTEDAQFQPFSVTVKKTRSGYKIRTKRGMFHTSTCRVPELGTPIETEVGTIVVHATRPLSPDTTYRLSHSRRELVVAGYQKQIKVKLNSKESNIINISTKSPLPSRDKALLNQMIEQYNLNAVVDKNMIASNTAAFIEERLAIITAELSEAENAVANYKEQNKIADLGTQSQIFIHASSAEQRQMVELETQLTLVDYIDDFLRDETKRNSLIPANLGLTDGSIASGISEYNALLLHKMRILRTATDDNPVIEQLNMQMTTIRQNILETISSVRESMKIRQRSMMAQDSKFNKQIEEAPEQQLEYMRVLRQQQIREGLYLYLYQKREENALMLAATAMPAKILDVPQRDVRSMSPQLPNLLVLCIFLGLMIPAGLLYLKIQLNDKIDDPKEFEKRIKAPMLGQLVQNSRNAHIAIHEGESTVSAELFRLIRTNLRFVLPADSKSPVILVTSCINGEGKSYVSCNTALSLAILGKKVVLVGLDIRKPMLATYFNLNTKGHLTDYLAEPDVTLDDIIVPSGEHRNLDLIPCGTIPPNPAELLQTERLDELFAALRERYDYIIVDSAPVALVSDTYLLDRVADMTMFVCRYKYTPGDMIDYINQVVEQQRMHNVVCVLNAVKGTRAGYGYGYGQKD